MLLASLDILLSDILFQYSVPDGGYFVVANLRRVKIPDNYEFPMHIAQRTRDFKLAWFLINELGIGAIPPSGEQITTSLKSKLLI
jgi:kynurenine aminotransferase